MRLVFTTTIKYFFFVCPNFLSVDGIRDYSMLESVARKGTPVPCRSLLARRISLVLLVNKAFVSLLGC